MNINICILALHGHTEESFFHDVARCVHRQYLSAGYSCTINTNKIIKGALNIIFGAGTSKAPKLTSLYERFSGFDIVIFNLEPLLTESPLVRQEYLDFISKYCVFDYSQENVDFLIDIKIRAFLFPIIPEQPCSEAPGLKKDIDIIFVGGLSERRMEILQPLQNKFSITFINGLYGSDLYPLLSRSRVLLNLHYYPNSPCELARFLPAVSRVSWILSETTVVPPYFLSVVDNLLICEVCDLESYLEVILYGQDCFPRKPKNHFIYNLISANADAAIHSITSSAF